MTRNERILCLQTLYIKEVRRFTKVILQTVVAPLVTTLLFFAVFVLALGHDYEIVPGVKFQVFLVPGLIMMAMVQNAFANTMSSIMTSKMQKNIVDTLMAPLTPTQLMIGYAGAGLTRGLVVGTTVGLALVLLVDMPMPQPVFIVAHAVLASLMLALLGMAVGIWADRFDPASAISNLVITPLAFLSGTFYSIQRLPDFWRYLAQFNPFFYMVDGFRFGFTGYHDGSLGVGLLVMVAINVFLWHGVHWMFASGYKLKA